MQRITKPYDEGVDPHRVFRSGHSGVLSIHERPMPDDTTYRVDYIPKEKGLPEKQYVGPNCRRGFLRQIFTEEAVDQLRREEEEEVRRQIEEKMRSETAAQFWKEQQRHLVTRSLMPRQKPMS